MVCTNTDEIRSLYRIYESTKFTLLVVWLSGMVIWIPRLTTFACPNATCAFDVWYGNLACPWVMEYRVRTRELIRRSSHLGFSVRPLAKTSRKFSD